MPDETIDAEVVEESAPENPVIAPNLPAVQAPAATLFRTEEPAEVVARAAEVAQTLAKVLRDQNLISRIRDRDHVRVEGWTLCGTMLGVFPVCVWTRQLDEGWEARVEARTLAGSVVGAAEAQCLRSESTWKGRDDYALRSMAQTRATSKALRQPLGFIVSLAGFDPTPAEEMPRNDPENPVIAQAYPVPKSWPQIEKAVRQCDNEGEAWALWEAFLRAATYHLYGKTSLKEIEAAERVVMAQKAAGAAVWLHENVAAEGPFTFFDEAAQRKAWAAVLEGTQLAIPDYVPPEPPGVDEEAERIAAEVFAEGESAAS